MSYTYKIRYSTGEENEYTDFRPCTLEAIEELIRGHWCGGDLPGGLKSIVICNKNGDALLLEHFHKHVFDVYFLPPDRRYHYHKKSTLTIVDSATKQFFVSDLAGLERSLNKTREDNKLVRNSIKSEEFIFALSERKNGLALSWTIFYGLPLWAVIMFPAFITPHTVSGMFAFIGLTFLWLWVPGFFLHFQYKKDNEHLIVSLSRGKDIIIAERGTQRKELQKADISSVVIYENPAYKLPWSNYGYAAIFFRNGDVLNLTNLMIDQFSVWGKFDRQGIDILKQESGFPRIRKKTNLF